MANIVEITDLEGTARLQIDNNTKKKFDPIRNERETSAIYQLLGAELGKLFYTELALNNPPTDARFKAIYDAFQVDDGSVVRESRGLKYFAMNIVWFFFARDNNIDIGLAGNSSAVMENSTQSADSGNLAKNYNKAIKTGQQIQWYICDNIDVYPEYNGQFMPIVPIL